MDFAEMRRSFESDNHSLTHDEVIALAMQNDLLLGYLGRAHKIAVEGLAELEAAERAAERQRAEDARVIVQAKRSSRVLFS